MPTDLKPETVEFLYEDQQFDAEGARSTLQSKLQSAEDRLGNLEARLEARKAELAVQAEEESRQDRAALESRVQGLRLAIEDVSSRIQPAG